ncbi:hypothetical protein T09_14549 [Trichinella sp. T9]|nr:hypothetical protein T09_14549 [Trichinella sp. T9]
MHEFCDIFEIFSPMHCCVELIPKGLELEDVSVECWIGMVELVLVSWFLVAGGWFVEFYYCRVSFFLRHAVQVTLARIEEKLCCVSQGSSYLADGFYVSWFSAKLLQLIYPILQCRSFGVVCSGSDPLTGHGSGRVVCGGCLIAGWIHRSLVRLRLGGPENVGKSLVRT